MAQLNKVYLMGNLTRDPELRRIANGTAVTELGLAINRSVPGKDGERRDEVTYIDVTVWDRQAENCVEYLKKGRPVHVEGFLKMDSWDDKTTGEKRYKLKVQAERVQFLGSREAPGSGGGEEDFSPPPQRESAPRRSAPEQPRNQGGGGGASRGYTSSNNTPQPSRRPPPPPVDSDGDEDDIPF